MIPKRSSSTNAQEIPGIQTQPDSKTEGNLTKFPVQRKPELNNPDKVQLPPWGFDLGYVEKDGRYSQIFQSKFLIDSETELLIDTQLIPAVRAVAVEILGFPMAKNEDLNNINFLFNYLHRIQVKGRWVVNPIDNQINLQGCYILPSGSLHKIQFRSFLKKLIRSCRILYSLATNPACPGKDVAVILGNYVDQHKEDFDWLVMG